MCMAVAETTCVALVQIAFYGRGAAVPGPPLPWLPCVLDASAVPWSRLLPLPSTPPCVFGETLACHATPPLACHATPPTGEGHTGGGRCNGGNRGSVPTVPHTLRSSLVLRPALMVMLQFPYACRKLDKCPFKYAQSGLSDMLVLSQIMQVSNSIHQISEFSLAHNFTNFPAALAPALRSRGWACW